MRILFYTIDGVGLGHLSRSLAVAEALKSIANPTIHFVTKAHCTDFLSNYHIPYTYLPSKNYRQTERILLKTIGAFKPDCIVYDTFFPRGMRRVCRTGTFKNVLILRSFKKEILVRELNRKTRTYSLFDLIIIPHKKSEFPASIPSSLKEKTIFVGPIVRDIKWYSGIKEKYNIQKNDFVVCASFGGGGGKGVLRSVKIILDAFVRLAREIQNVKFILITGPYFSKSIHIADNKIIISKFEPYLPSLISISHVVISQGGYNTLHEILCLKVPAIIIPIKTKMDDQYKRVNIIEKYKLGYVLNKPNIYALVKLLKYFYFNRKDRLRFVRNFKKLKLKRGNVKAARLICDMIGA